LIIYVFRHFVLPPTNNEEAKKMPEKPINRFRKENL